MSADKEVGKGAHRTPRGAGWGWRVPAFRTWTIDDNSSPRSPCCRPVMNLVFSALTLRALTCADSQGDDKVRGKMGGLEGASEAPSDGRERERRAWLTKSLGATSGPRRGGSLSPRAQVPSLRFCPGSFHIVLSRSELHAVLPMCVPVRSRSAQR